MNKVTKTLRVVDLETLELLNIPGFARECEEGLEEIKRGGGKKLVMQRPHP